MRIRDFETRFFPLVTFHTLGPAETMPLRIVRAARGLPRDDCESVNQELLRCGIVAGWLAPPEGMEYRSASPPCYRLGDKGIHWFSFPSTSTLVPPAAFWVAYDAAPDQYAQYSYVDVVNGAVKDALADKIVIVGTSAGIDPTGDTFSVPTSLHKVSVAQVVAAAIQTLLDERYFRTPPGGMDLLLAILLATVLALISSLLRPVKAVLISGIVLAAYLATAVLAYHEGWILSVLFVPLTGIVAGGLGGTYQLLLAIRRALGSWTCSDAMCREQSFSN